mmetsp:Transcript_31835/g.31118  ORF Transcript_31835/g.31118 Transcript_31835/m.31118 type:complete len:115 (-) Transcript_31835:163-507(-)|eukprot:CAMPEP_0170558374 /NCGR_PEP_ID=MMETSP0211-20121228/34906_1 /TAXON_ID=311385 /ORGANISM="Pseudokeronopsis sp., Strain OXSARD2" /LENGTH=114 /DNA_ID=CAMNT_0010870247 /DNA_START=374 /DNA_END=718 /DNA_ORIENTATION=-
MDLSVSLKAGSLVRSKSPKSPKQSEGRVYLKSRGCKKKQKLAQRWNNDFTVMASKNNSNLHSSYKEYFDRPLKYTPNGYGSTKKTIPMEIYHKKTPVRSYQQSTILLNCHKFTI